MTLQYLKKLEQKVMLLLKAALTLKEEKKGLLEKVTGFENIIVPLKNENVLLGKEVTSLKKDRDLVCRKVEELIQKIETLEGKNL